MIAQFLALALAEAPIPTDSGTTRMQNFRAETGTGGACSGALVATSATVVLRWDNYNIGTPVDYRFNVYQDNELVDTLAATESSWTKTVTNYVEAGTRGRFVADWRFRVALVAVSDGSLVDSHEVAWRQVYGRCPVSE